MKIAADIRLRHGVLWQLAEQFGTAKALAKEIGIGYQTLYQWLNLRCMPIPGTYTRFYTRKIEKRLEDLAGCPASEIFPEACREAIKVLAGNTRHVSIADVSPDALLDMAHATAARLTTSDPFAIAEAEDNKRLLRKYLQYIPERCRQVIEMRFGLYSPPMTLEECGNVLKLSRERIKQIEYKALMKLRQHIEIDKRLDLIPEALPNFTRIDKQWKESCDASLKQIVEHK